MEQINPVEFAIAMLARNARHEDEDCDFMAVKEDDGNYTIHEIDPNKPKYFDPKKAKFAEEIVKQMKKIKIGGSDDERN